MSSYKDYSDRFLAALYVETEEFGRDYVSAKDIHDKYGLTPKPHWVSRMADDWEYQHFRDVSKVLDGYEGWSFRISAEGFETVEGQFRDVAEIQEYLGVSAEQSSQEPSKEESLQDKIDSTDWTGLAKAITPSQKITIQSKANELQALILQSDADETTRLDACKRVEAVIALLEAPNTPWREVVSLLSNPVLNAFFAATSLVQFMVGLA